MPRIELPFADGFYVSESTPYLEKRCVNLYPVAPETDAPTRKALFHSHGITQFSDVTNGNSRGALVFNDGTPYRVIGTSLYSFNSIGTLTNHGTISGTSDVSMASNGINIAIIDPTGEGFFYTPSTSTLEQITNTVFVGNGQSTSVNYKDGFYIYTTDTMFFTGSAKTTNSGKDFDALDFGGADGATSLTILGNPEKIIKSHIDHDQLYILSEKKTNVYRFIGGSGFPYQIIPGAEIPKGCSARNTVIPFNGSFIFFGGGDGEQPGIYKALGSSTQKISTKSIDQLMHKLDKSVIEAARAFTFSENGNYFAVFTISDHTFVYDETTSSLTGAPHWHERQTGVTNATGFQQWRAIHGVKAYGKIQVGDDRSGLVGELDLETYTEYGNPIERTFSTKPFSNSGAGMFSKEVELYMETGLANDDDADPQIRMDYSDNGSRTFSNEISLSLGDVGEYRHRLRWKRLGKIPLSRVVRWKTTAPVPINIYGLFANAEAVERG